MSFIQHKELRPINSFFSRLIIIEIPLMSSSIHFNFVEKRHVIFTARKDVCEGRVFTGVCLSTGRGLCPGGLCPGGLCPGGLCPLFPGGLCPEAGLCLGGLFVMEGICQGDPSSLRQHADGTHPPGIYSCVLSIWQPAKQFIFYLFRGKRVCSTIQTIPYNLVFITDDNTRSTTTHTAGMHEFGS